MSFAAKETATQLAGVGSVEQFFDLLLGPLESGEVYVLRLEADFNTATAVRFAVYNTLDDSSEVWDTDPVVAVRLQAADGDPARKSLALSSVYKARVGVSAIGGLLTTADFSARRDQVNLASS